MKTSPLFIRYHKSLRLVALLALVTMAPGQPPRGLKTVDDLEPFMQTYYLHPKPELVADAITLLPASVYIKRTNALSPTIGFFSEVFSANPAQLADWRALVAKQDPPTKAALEEALALSQRGGVLKLEGASPQINDMYWGAFFATGKIEFLRKLVDQLRHYDERQDLNVFMAGATARWSLASNAQSHKQVRSMLETANLSSDKRTVELIRELLTRDPLHIKEEIREIVRKQRAAGAWK